MNMRSLSLILLLGVVAAGCNPVRSGATASPTSAANPLKVVAPEKKSVRRVVEQPGTVEAFEQTTLVAKIPGYILRISDDPAKTDASLHDRSIDIGSRVEKGQVLAELSVPELDEEVKQKEAVIRQTEAQVVQSNKALAAAVAGVTSARARVTEARAGLSRASALYTRWESEAERVGKLVTGGVIDAQTRDETLNQFKAAEASRAEAQAKVSSADAAVLQAEADREKAVSDVLEAEAELDVTKADARRVEALRAYTAIKSPFDGVVTSRHIDTGEFVSAGDRAGLFTVARIDPVRVVVHVPEADAGLVEVGKPIDLTFQAREVPQQTGTIRRTSWSLTPGSRTLRVEIDLPNPDGAIRPGMYVYAKLAAELPADWAIPSAAVVKLNDEPVIYLVKDGKAVRAAVQLGFGDTTVSQIRKYRTSGSNDWTAVNGDERCVVPAAAVSDGQAIVP